jgi:succinyl-CoA synthetase alpha subunit
VLAVVDVARSVGVVSRRGTCTDRSNLVVVVELTTQDLGISSCLGINLRSLKVAASQSLDSKEICPTPNPTTRTSQSS